MDLNFDFTEKRVIITAFFCMAFTIANLITVKIISIDFIGMQTPAGVLIYPLVYILTNVIVDIYGERTAWLYARSPEENPSRLSSFRRRWGL